MERLQKRLVKDIKIFLKKKKKKEQQNDLEGYKDLSEDELVQYNRKYEIRKALLYSYKKVF